MDRTIHWFPGHMTKSLRLIEENIKLVDAVIYILDARAPKSCINPSLDKIIKNKPVIYLLNKADLVKADYLNSIKASMKAEGKSVLALNSTISKSAIEIWSEIEKLCKERLDKAKAKGIKPTIRAMVIGVPNSGKSTFINNLSGVCKTVTGNKPGVTRGKQWVKVNDYFEVLDTPGTLYPKLDDQEKAKKLALIGSIKDEVLDFNELALYFIKLLDSIDPQIISARYNIETGLPSERLEKIAFSRGLLQKGGIPDIDKAAVALIDDYRKGRLGKIALENASE